MSDAPKRIWAYNSLLDGYTFTAKGPQPHFDGVEYIRADLMTELVEALKEARIHIAGSAPDWHYRTREILAVVDTALAKIKEQQA